MNRVRQHIRSDVGMRQVVKLRLEPATAQVELLAGYCGTARAAYNILLYQVRANLGQRAAEKTHVVEIELACGAVLQLVAERVQTFDRGFVGSHAAPIIAS